MANGLGEGVLDRRIVRVHKDILNKLNRHRRLAYNNKGRNGRTHCLVFHTILYGVTGFWTGEESDKEKMMTEQ